MYVVTDNLSHHMFAVCHCTNNTRSPMGKGRHGIIQMYRMVRPGSECCHGRIIICIGMRQGNIHGIFHFLNKSNCLTALLRRNADEFHQTFRCFQETFCNFHVAGNNVFLILRTLLDRADERAFHIQAEKICLRKFQFSFWHPVCFLFCPLHTLACCRIRRPVFVLRPLISRRIPQYLLQLLHRQRHGSRSNGCDSDRCLILRNLFQRLRRSIADICPHTSMEMQVNKTRNGISAFPIHHDLFRFFVFRESVY